MIGKITITTTTRFTSYHWQTYFLPGIIIVGCLAGLVLYVIPQGQEFITRQQAIAQKQNEIDQINSNISLLSRLDEKELQADNELATKALPTEKDFSGILNVISDTAQKSEVVLNDYSFAVGNIKGIDPNNPNMVITMKLEIKGTLDQGKVFITQLYEHVPLSSVQSLTLENDNTGLFTLTFYYKPAQTITIDPLQHISPLSAKQKELLKTLQTWVDNTPAIASLSADLSPIPVATSAPISITPTPTIPPGITPRVLPSP